VDDLFKANLVNSKKLFASVQTSTKNDFNLEDAIRMIAACPNISMTDKETTLAFAYSIFPVIDEMEELKDVLNLNFSEF